MHLLQSRYNHPDSRSEITMASSSTMNTFDFNSIPGGCLASIIAFMTPRDACRLALVSMDFLSASESDVVWEQFFPPDCDHIISRSDAGEALLTEFRKNKQLYMRLADHPLLVDAGLMSFWLEKSSGKKCWMIGARTLSIKWDDDPENWRWALFPESRFSEAAELIESHWIRIAGRIQTSMLSPGTQYAAYLVYKLASNSYGLYYADASIHSTGGGIITQRVNIPHIDPNPRIDGWSELKIGEFFTDSGEGEEEDEVELRVREVKDLGYKKGLIVEGIEVRPAKR